MTVLNQHPVSIVVDGRTVSGTYSTWAGRVTVTTARGSKMAELMDTPADVLARFMLRELVKDGKA